MDQDFLKQGPNSSLTNVPITQLPFTVAMPNLYQGKEMQNQSYVDQRKKNKPLMERVKTSSHGKSAGAGSERFG